MKVLVSQSCPALCDPMDCSRPGSSVHGISPRQEYWSGMPCPPPEDLPNPDPFIRIQCDWRPYEQWTFGHRQTQTHIERNVENTVCMPRSVQGCRARERDVEKILSRSPQREPNLPWAWTFSLQNYETTHFHISLWNRQTSEILRFSSRPLQ